MCFSVRFATLVLRSNFSGILGNRGLAFQSYVIEYNSICRRLVAKYNTLL